MVFAFDFVIDAEHITVLGSFDNCLFGNIYQARRIKILRLAFQGSDIWFGDLIGS